jgi:hypothetical protein
MAKNNAQKLIKKYWWLIAIVLFLFITSYSNKKEANYFGCQMGSCTQSDVIKNWQHFDSRPTVSDLQQSIAQMEKDCQDSKGDVFYSNKDYNLINMGNNVFNNRYDLPKSGCIVYCKLSDGTIIEANQVRTYVNIKEDIDQYKSCTTDSDCANILISGHQYATQCNDTQYNVKVCKPYKIACGLDSQSFSISFPTLPSDTPCCTGLKYMPLTANHNPEYYVGECYNTIKPQWQTIIDRCNAQQYDNDLTLNACSLLKR